MSDGAVSYYLDYRVKTRISRAAYGTFYGTTYNQKDLEHREREHIITIFKDGSKRIPGRFRPILPKASKFVDCKTAFWELTLRYLGYPGFRGTEVLI